MIRLTTFLHLVVREHHGAEHDLLRTARGLRFDHHHGIAGGGDDEVERAGGGLTSCLGLSVYSPSLKPTRAAPIGPMKGTPEMVSAAEAAIIATISGSVSPS
jgi:hypothetical protein